MKLLVVLASLIISVPLTAQHSIDVKITEIKKVKGAIEICLFDHEDNYMKDAIKCVWMDVTENEMQYTFDSLKAGDYAVVIIQDFNDNQDLDTNFMGIPKEPYGFSNNPSTTFGPPSFSGAKFMVDGKKQIEISLK